jgi:hypothetical protein
MKGKGRRTNCHLKHGPEVNQRQVESTFVGAVKRNAHNSDRNYEKGERENAGHCELLSKVNLNAPEEIDGNQHDWTNAGNGRAHVS